MRGLVIVGLIAAIITTFGCSQFNMNLAVGYRKIPPEVQDPLVHPTTETVMAKGKELGLTPDQIGWIIDFLSGENMKYFVPEDNRVLLGLEFDITAK